MEKIKLHVLMKRTWGDFDISQDHPIAVSSDKLTLVEEMNRLNGALTDADKRNEIRFFVGDNRVRLL